MQNNSAQLRVIKFIVLIAFIAMSVLYSVLPTLFIHTDFYQSHPLDGISSKTAILFVMGIYPLGLFFGSYVLGILSDKLGKRTTLLISLGLSGITQLICAIFIAENMFYWFITMRFFSGFFEGNISIARAAIANLCPDENTRKKHLGQTNAAMTLGWILGPALGALLNKISFFNSFLWPFVGSTILTFIVFYFSYRYFREPMVTINAPLANDMHFYQVTKKHILFLLVISFMLFLGIDCFYTFIPIYLTLALNATPLILALSASTVAIFNVLSNVFLVPKLTYIINTKKTVAISTLLLSTCLFFLAVLKSSYALLIFLPFIGINLALIGTNMSTYISMKLKPHKQGAYMGILLSQRTLGVTLLCLIFAVIVHINLGMPFLMGTIFLLTGLLLLITYSILYSSHYTP